MKFGILYYHCRAKGHGCHKITKVVNFELVSRNLFLDIAEQVSHFAKEYPLSPYEGIMR